MNAQTGLTPQDLADIRPAILRAKDEVLADFDLWQRGREVPRDKQPLEPGFIELPTQLLAEYRESRATSQLNQILSAAKKLTSLVDRVVLLGIGGSYMGARALFEACCHPHFNELSRAERGGHPRIRLCRPQH